MAKYLSAIESIFGAFFSMGEHQAIGIDQADLPGVYYLADRVPIGIR